MWTRVSYSDCLNYTLKTWVLTVFRFYWSVFYNQAINHTFAAMFRDYIGKDTGACWSFPMSYFEQVPGRGAAFCYWSEQILLSPFLTLCLCLLTSSSTSENLLESPSLTITKLLSDPRYPSLREALVSQLPTGFAAWAHHLLSCIQQSTQTTFDPAAGPFLL